MADVPAIDAPAFLLCLMLKCWQISFHGSFILKRLIRSCWSYSLLNYSKGGFGAFDLWVANCISWAFISFCSLEFKHWKVVSSCCTVFRNSTIPVSEPSSASFKTVDVISGERCHCWWMTDGKRVWSLSIYWKVSASKVDHKLLGKHACKLLPCCQPSPPWFHLLFFSEQGRHLTHYTIIYPAIQIMINSSFCCCDCCPKLPFLLL